MMRLIAYMEIMQILNIRIVQIKWDYLMGKYILADSNLHSNIFIRI